MLKAVPPALAWRGLALLALVACLLLFAAPPPAGAEDFDRCEICYDNYGICNDNCAETGASPACFTNCDNGFAHCLRRYGC